MRRCFVRSGVSEDPPSKAGLSRALLALLTCVVRAPASRLPLPALAPPARLPSAPRRAGSLAAAGPLRWFTLRAGTSSSASRRRCTGRRRCGCAPPRAQEASQAGSALGLRSLRSPLYRRRRASAPSIGTRTARWCSRSRTTCRRAPPARRSTHAAHAVSCRLTLPLPRCAQCLKYKTDQAADLKKVEKLNALCLSLMGRGLGASPGAFGRDALTRVLLCAASRVVFAAARFLVYY
jgi:hypothetical protein